MALANLLTLDPGDDNYFDEVLQILEAEPNFSARILIAANSAESAPAQPVTTVSGAVARIGSRGAANLVLALAVTRVFVPRNPWERSLWRHGVQVAHAARAFASHVEGGNVHPDEAYAGGLLHDIGRFVLFQEAPEGLRAVDESDWETPVAMIEQEREICGITHPELGAMACERWRLPEVITRIVREHHENLSERSPAATDELTQVVQLADLAMFSSAKSGLESASLDTTDRAERLQPHIPSFLSLPGPQLVALMERAEADADEACRTLGITA